MKKKIDLSLCFIADRAGVDDAHVTAVILQALGGGATMIQLRGKTLSARVFTKWAQEVRRAMARSKVPLIINDRVDVALAVDADGVHLGQDDMPIADARKLLGRNKIIGISAHTAAEARAAEREGADYIGVGTVFPTDSKPNIRAFLGVKGLRSIRAVNRLPMLAIGGIDTHTVAEVMSSGVDGVAVISAILKSDDPGKTCEHFRSLIKIHRKKRRL